MNLQNFYKVTVSNEQLRQAFLSSQGINDLIGYIVDSLYTGAEFDEYITMKQLIVDAANNGEMYAVNIPAVSSDNTKTIVSTIKGVSNQLEFMSSTYNSMGVLTHTRKTDKCLLLMLPLMLQLMLMFWLMPLIWIKPNSWAEEFLLIILEN